MDRIKYEKLFRENLVKTRDIKLARALSQAARNEYITGHHPTSWQTATADIVAAEERAIRAEGLTPAANGSD